MRYRTGDIEFDEDTATLHGPRGAVPLRKQVAQTLTLLLTRAPALVSTDELLDAVWGRHAISPSAVPQAIRELRRVLGDQAQESTYIETRHRLGYRWIPPVELLASATAAAASEAAAESLSEPTEAEPIAVESLPVGQPIAASIESPTPPKRTARWFIPALLLAALLQAIVFWTLRDFWWPMPADAFAYTGDPGLRAAQSAFFEYRLADSERALADVAQDEVATQLLRARIAILRADGNGIDTALAAAREHLDDNDRPGKLWVDAIAAQADGRDIQAWIHLEPLLALHPDNLDLLLLAWDLRSKLPASRVNALVERLESADDLPASRRALLGAQVAGGRRQGAMHRERAERVLADFGPTNPAMAAMALIEVARAAELMGDAPGATTIAREAGEALQGLGFFRPAVRALRDAVWNARSQDQFDAAEQHLARMQQLLDGRRDPLGAITMRHLRAQLFASRGDHAAAIEAFTQLASDYQAIDDGGGAANALNSTLNPLYLLGRSDEVPAVIERALQLANRAQAVSTAGFLHGSLGNHYVRNGDLQRGQDQIMRALESFRASGEKRAEATALGNLSEVAAMRGRMDEAVQFNERALALERAQNRPNGVAYAQYRLARVHAARGDLPSALEIAEQAAAGFRRAGSGKEEAMARAQLGLFRLQGADLNAARALLAEIEALASNGLLAQAQPFGLAGAIAYYEGDFETARARFESEAQAWLNLREKIDARQAQVDALRARLASNDWIAVEEEVRELLKRSEVAQSSALQREAQLLLAQTLLAQERRAEAEAALSEIDSLLAQAPDADTELRVVLLRARMDRNPKARYERLVWAATQAESKGLRLLALEVRGVAARERGTEALRAWEEEAHRVQALGLLKLIPMVR